MGKTLTISIAAYNMERYIRQTLDSTIDARTVDELEIFVVDDGGTDRTLEIAREYAARYPQSVFPIHKENGGYGTTVNYSIDHATGKYFKTLDGDDWFDREGLYKLVCHLKEADADVVVTNYREGSDEANLKPGRSVGEHGEGILKISELGDAEPIPMACCTYKTEMLRKSGLRMPGKIFYTDQYYVAVPYVAARTIQYLNFDVYCYRIGREGQTVDRKSKIKHTEDTIRIAKELCEFYEKNRENVNRQYLCVRVGAAVTYAYHALLINPISRENLSRIKQFEREVRAISPDVYKTAETVGRTGKVIAALRRTHYLAYWLMALLPNR